MSAYNVLELTVNAVLDSVKPLHGDWVARLQIIQELQDVINSLESFRGATVEPFGSFVSNLFSRWGDLDISITLPLPNGSYISSTGKKQKQILLVEVMRALRLKGGVRRLQFIPNARVPILKFESNLRSISCDISIDNLQGQIKSKFLHWINETDGRFRDMVLLVKEWAKAHNINNSKAGTFNSYSLSLLVIFHFQTCVPAILPPLRDLYPRNAVDDLAGVRTNVEAYIAETFAANIARYRSNKSKGINRSSLSKLFVLFLAKFSDISSRSVELGICPFTGQWEDVTSNMRWLPRTYALFIEDPFEQPENTARGVSAGNLTKISEAFQTTYQKLVSSNQNQMSLLDTLVRPHISHSITGIPVGNPRYPPMYHPTTHLQMSMPVHSAPQGQHLKNVRQGDHPNNLSRQRKESGPNNLSKQKKGGSPNNLTNQRQGGHPNNLAAQRPESHPNNLQESHPNKLNKQKQDRQPKNLTKQTQEIHPSNIAKQKQESHPNKSIDKRPVQRYHSQGQLRWRPKNES
uniref:Zinc finger protein n=1 Tax=Rhizophora mucronata TaxID=61149 RepID=A0A2P2JSI1_RHIMU